MGKQSLGVVGIKLTGAYNSATTYKANQAAKDAYGNYFVSKKNNNKGHALPVITNGVPAASDWWEIMWDLQSVNAAKDAANAAAARAEAQADVITGEIGEIAAKVTAEMQVLQVASFGIRWSLDDTVKQIEIVGNTTLYNKFKQWCDNSPKPCEIKKDMTDFAYLLNTAGVASNENWTKRADGSASHYASADKLDYLQLVELENINISGFVNALDRTMTVYFNLDDQCPNGFYRWFKNAKKCMSRYDLTFNADRSTLDCAAGTTQPSGNFSANIIHSMTVATNANLLNWTAWEIIVLGWLQIAYYQTFDVPSSERGRGIESGSESAARNYVNGSTDTLTTPHGGVSNKGYRFMYMENCTDGKQWLWGAGWKFKANGKAVMTMDDAKANAAVLIADDDAEITVEFVKVDAAGWEYPKNVSLFSMATELGGSTSSGVYDGQYLTPSCANNVFYAGGTSHDGLYVGVLARDAGGSASHADWGRRGRCAVNR